MTKIRVTVEVPEGDRCNKKALFNKEEKCIMLGQSYNYCRLFKTRLKLDWISTRNGLFLQPIKCPQCIKAEVKL